MGGKRIVRGLLIPVAESDGTLQIREPKWCAPRSLREPGLGAAKSFVDDFFWSWRCFEISVFDLVSVGRGYRIDETVKLGKVASIGALDGLLDAVVARN